MNRITLVIAVLVVLALPACSQIGSRPTTRPVSNAEPIPLRVQSYRWGGFTSFNVDHHFAAFKELPGMRNCCDGFESGSGYGFTVGGLFEIPMPNEMILGVRGDWTSYASDTLRSLERIIVGIEGIPTPATSEHSLATTINDIGLQASLAIPLFDRLYLNVGPRFGILFGGSYSYLERLIDPVYTGAFMPDGSRTRNPVAGSLNSRPRFGASLMGGLSYEVPLCSDRTVIGAPEISYSYGLTDVADGVDWTVNTIRLGVAIKFVTEAVIYGPPPPKPSQINAGVQAFGVNPDGTEDAGRASMRVDESTINEVCPLLSYVFFDDGSAAISDRYQREGSQPMPYAVPRASRIDAYYALFDTIARRMAERPTETIDVVGCNAAGAEPGGIGLSRQRAVAVQTELTRRGVHPSRIRVYARDLPAIPSSMREPDGIAENRRAEILGSWEILKPVTKQTTTMKIVTPSTIRFRASVVADDAVAGWTLRAMQGGHVVKEFSGLGAPPPALDWQVSDAEAQAIDWARPVSYAIEARDAGGRVARTNEGMLALNRSAVSRSITVDRCNLILFDFDRADLGPKNMRIVDSYIRPRIASNSTVSITGYTDRVGEAAHNLALSERRANETASVLGVGLANARGLGESPGLYDNSFPEGRFYCRTVSVEVQTPRR